MMKDYLDVQVKIHRFPDDGNIYDLTFLYRTSPDMSFHRADESHYKPVRAYSATFSRLLPTFKVSHMRVIFFDWKAHVYMHSFDSVENDTASLTNITGLSKSEVDHVIAEIQKVHSRAFTGSVTITPIV